MRRAVIIILILVVAAVPAVTILSMIYTETYGILSVYLVSIPATLVVLAAVFIALKRTLHPVGSPSGEGRSTGVLGLMTEKQFDRIFRSQLVWWLVLVPLVFLPGNIVRLLNQWLDHSSGVEDSFVVEEKHLTQDKSHGDVYFTIRQQGSPGSGIHDRVAVLDRSLYDRIVPNQSKVVMTLHRGAFGFPWTAAEPRWTGLAPTP